MNRRTNIARYQMDTRFRPGVRVYAYEDHRILLDVLYFERTTNGLPTPITLIYFDYHADNHAPIAPAALMAQYRQNLPPEREFWSFVEWDLRTLDDDWLKTGMELNLIADAILIGGCDDGIPIVENYTDGSGVAHRIHNVGHVWEGLGVNGWLCDPSRAVQLQPIWDPLGWGQVAGRFQFMQPHEVAHPLVLDFDLDCFSVRGPEGPMAWPSYRFGELFSKRFNHDRVVAGYRSDDFVAQLAGLASFVTIARESPYCGGYGDSDKILANLDALLFNGLLRRQR